MPQTTFLSDEELRQLGLKSYGTDVSISRNCVIYHPDKVEIGSHVRIDDFAVLSGRISMGDHVHVAQFVGLYGGDEGIVLEDYTGVSSKSTIYATSNDYSGEYMTNPTVPQELTGEGINGKVVVKKHVVIGCSSVILPGVTIGTGSALGSMSLCLKDVPEWGIYVGAPVRKIKDRSKHLLELEKEIK